MTKCKINNEEIIVKGIDEVPMFSWNINTKEFYVLGHKFDGVNSIEDFVNYIYNLEKENQILQSQLKNKEDATAKFEKYLNNRVNELENEYETSALQKTINSGIVDITKVILSKFNEVFLKKDNK